MRFSLTLLVIVSFSVMMFCQGNISAGINFSSRVDQNMMGIGATLKFDILKKDKWSIGVRYSQSFQQTRISGEYDSETLLFVDHVHKAAFDELFFVQQWKYTVNEGILKIHAGPEKVSVSSLGVNLGYYFGTKKNFTLAFTPNINYVNLTEIEDYIKLDEIQLNLSNTKYYEIVIPVFRYERFIDVGVNLGAEYAFLQGRDLSIGIAAGLNYLIASGLMIGDFGIRFGF
jgi:hypothetical protein